MYQIKLSLIDVGKSNMLTQFMNDKFRGDHVITIGVEFLTKTIQIDKKDVQIQVWDTVILLYNIGRSRGF
jgi:GTPase SAR1 family protein